MQDESQRGNAFNRPLESVPGGSRGHAADRPPGDCSSSTSDRLTASVPALSRRRFLAVPVMIVATGVAESLLRRLPLAAAAPASRSVHPQPRPGITAANILPPDALSTDKARRLYDLAREIPEVLDGIHCYCECDGDPMNHRSLLSCFESDQAAGCYACGKEARLVHRLHRDGKSLAEIRAAVDREFA